MEMSPLVSSFATTSVRVCEFESNINNDDTNYMHAPTKEDGVMLGCNAQH